MNYPYELSRVELYLEEGRVSRAIKWLSQCVQFVHPDSTLWNLRFNPLSRQGELGLGQRGKVVHSLRITKSIPSRLSFPLLFALEAALESLAIQFSTSRQLDRE